MQKRATFLGATALFVGFATSSLAQSATDVVVTVGETQITLGELIIARAQLPQQYDQFPPDVLWDGILDQVVQQALLAETKTDVPLRVELALKHERRSLLAGEAVNTLMGEVTSEDAIQEAYDARFADAEPTKEFNASHLLVETEEEAQAALDRINGGEFFADVARDVSTGPTGPNGGNLGWFGAGQMVPEFEATVMALDVGGVSDPVQTQFGWHVVTLLETRTQDAPSLEDLRAELTEEVQRTAVADYIAELTENADITRPEAGDFDPNILSDLSLIEPTSE